MALDNGSKAELGCEKALINIENLTPDKVSKFSSCMRSLAEELGMKDEKPLVDKAIEILRRLNALNCAYETIKKWTLTSGDRSLSSAEAPIDIENRTPDKAVKFFNCVKTLTEELKMENEKGMVDETIRMLCRAIRVYCAFRKFKEKLRLRRTAKSSKCGC